MSIIFLLLLPIVATIVPALICFWLARIDARQNRRALARRTLSVAATLTAAVTTAIAVLVVFLVRSTAPNASFGVNWIAIGIALTVLFLWASASGAIGYSIGMRLFRITISEGKYGGEQVVQRLDESGNPYQPPST